MFTFICPKCGKSHYSVGISFKTAMYFEPEFVNGVNINPDRNITTTSVHCLECNNNFIVKERFGEIPTIEEVK